MTKDLITGLRTGLHGTLTVPGDKSISHRGIMLGALATGQTILHNFLTSADCLSTLQAFRDMGVVIDRAGTDVAIDGVGLHGLRAPQHALNMGNSGTTTRLIMGILAGQEGTFTLEGDASLSRRPMGRVSEPLAKFGAQIATTDGTLPATITGTPVHSADVQLAVASAQVKSALIFAALQADGMSVIREKLPTRDHTERMLQAFGAELEVSADHMTIALEGKPVLHGQTVEVPGDMSSAAFFMVAATLVPGSDITLKNVGLNPTRTGLLDLIQQMGGNIEVESRVSGGEPLGDLRVRAAELHAVDLGAEQVPAIIDELPLVALLAAHAKGTSHVTGAAELRVKETDRIKALATELGKLGIQVEELPDGFVITGQQAKQVVDPQLDSWGDHRIGMMLALAALQVDQPLTLAGADAVGISYPQFFADLAELVDKESEISK